MYKSLQIFLCVVAISHARPGFLPGGLHGLAGLAYSAAVVAPAPAVIAPAVSVSNQYHAQDALGQYSYGYSGDTSAKAESKTADGVTRGGYSYVDGNGLVQSANYVADPVNGFRVAATNIPVHVAKDTPEVAVAKVAHAVAYNEAAAAAAAAPDVPEPVAVVAPGPAVYAAGAPAFAPAVYAAGAPAFAPAVYAAGTPAFAPAVYAAGAPAIVSGHAYTAPGIVASANTAGGFSYSAHSVGPAYAPRFYSGVLPGPIAPAPVLVNGVPVPVDTPEVASAKAAHYAAHIEAKLRHFG